MNPRATEIFSRAYVLSSEEREALLAEVCGEDAALRVELERMLADSDSADSFFGNADEELETIATSGTFDSTSAVGGIMEKVGDVVGPYTLQEQIGEGGFGTVWLASQSEPIVRQVALKVVKAGMDTKQVLARFEAERQALAMLDHPNIAKVLDAGATDNGRPYFAMELVDGVPITEFCRREGFGPRRRLELFREVCSAVNHAHQKGIIHRDLKPSNILVALQEGKPLPKVIDFGIAKATESKLTEKTLFTRYEQILGTPAYMSPEQAAMSGLDVDTRSDIYSLGVLLYELLAGKPPFDSKSLLSAGLDEMRRIIREEDPPRPSTKLTQFRRGPLKGGGKVSFGAVAGDLDWIVMKAIEKDRARRYETANALAADIGRHLSDEPVEAAAPSAAYKFRKFARRHRAGFAVGTGFVVLLVVATIVSSWLAFRAIRAEGLASSRLEDAEEAREKETEARLDAEAVAHWR